MNLDQMEGKWKQWKGAAKEQWGKLTDDDLDVIAGKRDQLIGKIQERYGIAKAEAKKEAESWIEMMENMPDQGAGERRHGGVFAERR